MGLFYTKFLPKLGDVTQW
ncbi:unnamed protein product [Acanthoscelides obtectus]|uniref:Uncharacterized protein n=1 Tax=Acanthoscelides obtectus TaxID=200917 RepID=A0A9P0M762_ACAOB|nr:unnamed protein product [Acanthoscelides obtectus]CAK1644593.1 hypothetical protein AOBTE_LOCUS13888 [Acanthoscelides obtectus]